jgi:hypothetical protein
VRYFLKTKQHDAACAATEVQPANDANEREWRKVLKQKITKETKIQEAKRRDELLQVRQRPVANTRGVVAIPSRHQRRSAFAKLRRAREAPPSNKSSLTSFPSV